MDNFQKEIDERTNLTASNKFELLLFRLGTDPHGERSELFGINVFKIREIVPMPPVTKAAGTQSPMLGMVNIRGQIISVIDLPAVVGCVPKTGLNILLVTEYARSTQLSPWNRWTRSCAWSGARCCRPRPAAAAHSSPASPAWTPTRTPAAWPRYWTWSRSCTRSCPPTAT